MNRSLFVSIVLASDIVLGGVTVLVPVAASAAFTEISASTLKHEGVRYWRKKAGEAKLGSVGQKMTPVGGMNYFQKMQDAPNGIYKLTVDAQTTITSKSANEWGVTASASNVQGGVSHSGEYNGTITAYKMRIDLGNLPGNLRYATNRHISHLDALKHEGNGGRLISAVWILVAGDESKAECYSGDLTVTNGAWNVSTSASGCAASSWTIAPTSIIAYEMAKVDRWNNEEILVRPSCPASYPTYETRSSIATPEDRCKRITYDYVGVECQLGLLDNADNWYVSARDGRDTCKSTKGKPDKEVKCSRSGYDYVVQAGKDTCRKGAESYSVPSCPNGYEYDKKSTSNGGVDQCKLRGIESLKPDSQDGF